MQKKCPVSIRINHLMVKVVTLQGRVSNQTHSDGLIYQGHVPELVDGVWESFRSLTRRHNAERALLLNNTVLGLQKENSIITANY